MPPHISRGKATRIIKRAEQLLDQIKPIMAGEDVEVQGALLANLVAIFIAGHPPALRAKMLELQMDCTRDLVAPTVEEMIAKGMAPEGWR